MLVRVRWVMGAEKEMRFVVKVWRVDLGAGLAVAAVAVADDADDDGGCVDVVLVLLGLPVK